MTTNTNPPSVNGSVVTTKMALTYVAGQREILVGQRNEAARVGLDTEKLDKAIASMEVAEAALVAFLSTKKSAFKAGVAAGFVPYGPSADGGRRPSVLPGRS